MNRQKNSTWIAFTLLVILLAISLLKDELTPDYRNTPNAAFLNPDLLQTSRVATLALYPWFWLKALLYTLSFIGIPAATIHFAFHQKNLTRFTLFILTSAALLLYLTIFINSSTLDHVLVSKVNRYLHSPIITLFLWAAFKLTTQPTPHDKQV